MRVHRPLVGVAVSVAAVLSALTPMSASRAGAKPSPIPVVFGPNVNLSVQSSSQGKYAREPTIVVNPANPLDIVEGNIVQQPTQFFGVDTFSFSTDGGQTWTLGGIVPMENPGDDALDPALAADAEGNIYYSYLTDVLGTAGTNLRTDLRVAKSTDGGRSFPS